MLLDVSSITGGRVHGTARHFELFSTMHIYCFRNERKYIKCCIVRLGGKVLLRVAGERAW